MDWGEYQRIELETEVKRLRAEKAELLAQLDGIRQRRWWGGDVW